MATVIDNQKALRPLQGLPFCYLCNRTFIEGEPQNKDHVPPSALFQRSDRNFPLILPSHPACNSARSAEDEVVSQLVGLLHDESPKPKTRQVRIAAGQFQDGTTGVGAVGLPLKAIIWRWVRGFHAALYRAPIPYGARYSIVPPLPEGLVTNARVEPIPIAEVAPALVEELKRNRTAGTLDSVTCRNGACRYECVWTQADNGRRICAWALDLYGWRELGESRHFDARGCVGVYHLPEHAVPEGASLATTLHFPFDNRDKLDPFGS